MKKIFALMLSVLVLLTFACCGTKTVEEEETVPEINEELEYDSVVEININPSFRMYLDAERNVLAVESLNGDAESVCANLELTGKSFDEAFSEILEESVAQEFLTDGKTVDVKVVRNVSGYAPDVIQNAAGIVTDITTAHEIEAEVKVSMAEEIIEEQSQEWNEEDVEVYVVEEPAEGEPDGDNPDEAGTEEEHEPTLCSTCNGEGQVLCEYCNGSGEVTCVECDGTGVFEHECDKCEGGLVVCEICGGDYNHVLCGVCQGKGVLAGKCPYCGGTGKCSTCGGSGQEAKDDGSMGPCHACGGNGLCTNLFYGVEKACGGAAPCNGCDGSGYTHCTRCTTNEDGSESDHPGYEVCREPNCEGGIVKDPCSGCDSTGIQSCGNCEGTGYCVCPDCDGTGYID